MLRSTDELARELREAFIREVDSYCSESSATTSNKMALKNFWSSRGTRIIGNLVDHIVEADRELERVFLRIRGLETERDNLEMEITQLEGKRKDLDEKFTDPKAREAFTLYTEVLKTGKGDNGYESCRRITAAGAMAAAFLGLQRYGGGAKENDLEEDAK